ncbi:hypothetical protein GW915_03340 [bacterium]|nr:hypothetical protein [bacterium]
MKKLFSLSAMCLLLVNCGSEGSGNFTVQGAGSATSVSSTFNGISSSVLNPFGLASDDLLPVGSAISPSELQIKVSQFWISTSADCSNPILVFEDLGADYQNILTTGTKPTFGRGSVEPANYKCVIMGMNDIIQYRPASSDGQQCVAGELETLDVCGAGSGSFDHPEGSVYADGTCSGANDVVPLYLSNFSGSNGDAFNRPTESGSGNGISLSGELEVGTASVNSFFVVDGTDQVSTSGGNCEMQPPTFSFVTP